MVAYTGSFAEGGNGRPITRISSTASAAMAGPAAAANKAALRNVCRRTIMPLHNICLFWGPKHYPKRKILSTANPGLLQIAVLAFPLTASNNGTSMGGVR